MLYGTARALDPTVHRTCTALYEKKRIDLGIKTESKFQNVCRSETTQFSVRFCVVIWSLISKYET